MPTEQITVPSTFNERGDGFANKVFAVLNQNGVTATEIGGGVMLGVDPDELGCDNDFEIVGDQESLDRAKAAVTDTFGREVRVWEDE